MYSLNESISAIARNLKRNPSYSDFKKPPKPLKIKISIFIKKTLTSSWPNSVPLYKYSKMNPRRPISADIKWSMSSSYVSPENSSNPMYFLQAEFTTYVNDYGHPASVPTAIHLPVEILQPLGSGKNPQFRFEWERNTRYQANYKKNALFCLIYAWNQCVCSVTVRKRYIFLPTLWKTQQ